MQFSKGKRRVDILKKKTNKKKPLVFLNHFKPTEKLQITPISLCLYLAAVTFATFVLGFFLSMYIHCFFLDHLKVSLGIMPLYS